MPLYDFECAACGERFEELIAAGEAAACPACGEPGARRLYSQVSPPARIGLRGPGAAQSNAIRGEREAARRERIADARKRRGAPGS
jgi:putative FmdB family regulatory protein